VRNISDKILQKIKTNILCSTHSFFRKSCRLRDNVQNMVHPDMPHMKM